MELPIPDPGKLSKYLTSDQVNGIQVVENAPGVDDNILYFEYEPIPDQATYGFQVGFEDTPKAEVPVVANVTLKTMLIGENGIDGVNVIFGITEKPSEASTVTFKATDSLGQEQVFVNSGTWGPPDGFNISADYEAITPWTLIFSEPGIYKSFYKLVDAQSGHLYAEAYITVQVEQS